VAESLRVRVREHNLSNQYGTWLESVIYQRREAR
jgi:hypothetical protein